MSLSGLWNPSPSCANLCKSQLCCPLYSQPRGAEKGAGGAPPGTRRAHGEQSLWDIPGKEEVCPAPVLSPGPGDSEGTALPPLPPCGQSLVKGPSREHLSWPRFPPAWETAEKWVISQLGQHLGGFLSLSPVLTQIDGALNNYHYMSLICSFQRLPCSSLSLVLG